jgi:hypothetical protein
MPDPSPKKIKKLVSAMMPLVPLLIGMKVADVIKRLSGQAKKDEQ